MIFEKVVFYLSKTMVFEGQGGPKNDKKPYKNKSEKNVKNGEVFFSKKSEKARF